MEFEEIDDFKLTFEVDFKGEAAKEQRRGPFGVDRADKQSNLYSKDYFFSLV